MKFEPQLAAAISAAISEHSGEKFQLSAAETLSGGCIHSAWMVGDGKRRYFVKTNQASTAAMLSAEAAGLAALAAADCVRVPACIAQGEAAGTSFLVLEYLELQALGTAAGQRLGESLARQHQLTGASADQRFGWSEDNFIGSSVQHNKPQANWPLFFAESRLAPQLRLAAANGMARGLRDRADYLASHLAAFFLDYSPRPSLLHGDLWGGNAAQLPDGTAVIFDPAVYRGDREADLAMSELFGGFPSSFYLAYRNCLPLDAGYEIRKTLYNLYHILNHFNLFGTGYLGQAERMIERLCASLRG